MRLTKNRAFDGIQHRFGLILLPLRRITTTFYYLPPFTNL
jgi:hypothetical protein